MLNILVNFVNINGHNRLTDLQSKIIGRCASCMDLAKQVTRRVNLHGITLIG